MVPSAGKRSLKGLGTALRTLTIIPCDRSGGDDFGSSLMWFPFVGTVLGLILYAIGWIWMRLPFSPWPALAALLMMGAEIWLTRGLHLDGLADWADSIGGGGQRVRRLAIMKDTSVGAFGVLALILALLGKWIAFERLLCSGTSIWVVPVLCLSRAVMAGLLMALPYARAEGGMGKPFVATGAPIRRTPVYGLTLAVCLMLGPLGVLLGAAGYLQAALFKTRIRHAFGGITGDLLGTANEMVELTFLVLLAVPGKGLLAYTGWNWLFTC